MTDEEILARADELNRERLKTREAEMTARKRVTLQRATQKMRGDIAIALGLPGITDEAFDDIVCAVQEYQETTELIG